MDLKFRTLRADEVDVRVATVSEKGCSLLLYKDARVDCNILDETVGAMNWQRKHDLINGNLFCSVGIYRDHMDDWIWKQDVGVESYTEKEKGQASDSFKRACFLWGIGRELYTAPFIWISSDKVKLTKNTNGKYTIKNAYFKVKQIGYDAGKIVKLEITCKQPDGNQWKESTVYSMGLNKKETAKEAPKKSEPAEPKPKPEPIDEPAKAEQAKDKPKYQLTTNEMETLQALRKAHHMKDFNFLGVDGINKNFTDWAQFTKVDFCEIVSYFQQIDSQLAIAEAGALAND